MWTSLGAQAQAPRSRTGAAAAGRQIPRQGPNEAPLEAPGEIVVRVGPGVDGAVIATRNGLQARKLRFAPDTYVFSQVPGDLQHAVARIQGEFGVLHATKNRFFRPRTLPQITPDDPFVRDQWALRVLNAPRVWGINVGERLENGPRKDVLVGLIDFGPESFHEDLFENISPNGWDFILNQPYDEFQAPIFQEGHGTNVAGTIAPATNNTAGVAGLPWEGVTILPAAVGELVANVPVFRLSAVLDAISFCVQEGCDVINMSFGYIITAANPADPLIAAALADAYDQGVIAVAAAGDDNGGFTFAGLQFPASVSTVISVGAVGPTGALATTSNFGPTVVAPGGDDPTNLDPTRQVLVPESEPSILGGYDFRQGTSLAAGYTSSTIAMLITQGALEVLDAQLAANPMLPRSARVDFIRNLLVTTARPVSGQFNFGNLITPDAALARVTHFIDYSSPVPNEVTESFAEPLVARIVHPVPHDLTLADFTVVKNGIDVTGETEIVSPASGSIRYEPTPASPAGVYNIGLNNLNVTADSVVLTDATRSTVGPAVLHPVTFRVLIPERTYRFRVRPRVENPGMVMWSLPYELQAGANTLQFLAGGNVVALARWIPTGPDSGAYSIFYSDHSPQDPEADLLAADSVARPPIGNGYWARIAAQTQLQILGAAERNGFYEIAIHPGWNQIGNPYNFRVPYNTVSVRFGQEVMRVDEAFRRGLMRNALWRYEQGRYTFQIPPRAELIPWESQWVYSNTELILVVPRVISAQGDVTASAATGPAKVASSALPGWRSAIRASSGGVTSAEVFLGQSALARDGYGLEDVELPPPSPNGVELRVANGGWGSHSGGYAQDVRSSGAAQRWNLEVETSRPGQAVKLTWDRFPAGTRAYLQVEGEHQARPLTHRGDVQLKFGRPGVRRLTVVAAPQKGV